jgi:hypothetical protein
LLLILMLLSCTPRAGRAGHDLCHEALGQRSNGTDRGVLSEWTRAGIKQKRDDCLASGCFRYVYLSEHFACKTWSWSEPMGGDDSGAESARHPSPASIIADNNPSPVGIVTGEGLFRGWIAPVSQVLFVWLAVWTLPDAQGCRGAAEARAQRSDGRGAMAVVMPIYDEVVAEPSGPDKYRALEAMARAGLYCSDIVGRNNVATRAGVPFLIDLDGCVPAWLAHTALALHTGTDLDAAIAASPIAATAWAGVMRPSLARVLLLPEALREGGGGFALRLVWAVYASAGDWVLVLYLSFVLVDAALKAHLLRAIFCFCAARRRFFGSGRAFGWSTRRATG